MKKFLIFFISPTLVLVFIVGVYFFNLQQKQNNIVTAMLRAEEEQDARNSHRDADILTLSSGLDLYYRDVGEYPPTLSDLVSKHIILAVPQDPQTNMEYKYQLIENGQNFQLCATYESLTEKCIVASTKAPTVKNLTTGTAATLSEQITGRPFVETVPDEAFASLSPVAINNFRVTMARSIQALLSQYINNNNPAQYTPNNVDYIKYPSKLSSIFGGGTTPMDPITKKPFEYRVASDGKDYTLCAELQTGVKTCGNKNTDWYTYIIK